MSKLIEACYNGQFPDLRTMSHYGMTSGNPVSTFECYKRAIIQDGKTALQLDRAMKANKLTHLILNSQSVINNRNSVKHIESGWNRGVYECPHCSFVCEGCVCENCHT
jgi:hypothetical protein